MHPPPCGGLRGGEDPRRLHSGAHWPGAGPGCPLCGPPLAAQRRFCPPFLPGLCVLMDTHRCPHARRPVLPPQLPIPPAPQQTPRQERFTLAKGAWGRCLMSWLTCPPSTLEHCPGNLSRLKFNLILLQL